MHPVRPCRLLTVVAFVAAASQAWAQLPAASPAYLLLELPSQRVLAESRPDILRTPIAPGSVMKLVTLAAAFEQGTAGAGTRIICRRTVDVDGRPITCVHPDLHRALDPSEAIGHSCNVYFATLATRLQRNVLDGVLVRVGLNPSNPSTPLATVALGLGGVRATPPELLEAFCRLTGSSRTEVRLPDETRRTLRLGLELAARTGTAAAFSEAGFSGLAKTGTAPMPGGGYLGLVTAIVNTELPTHAIVVVAPGSTGAHAAALAAEILIRHGVPRRGGVGRGAWDVGGVGVRSPGPLGPGDSSIRLGRVRRSGGYDVTTVAMEDYVAQAVTGEGEVALPPAAQEALAITVRTFAERNRGRHSPDGFDLCDLTHCLVVRRPTAATTQAAAATRGMILTAGGQTAEVYLSASCGGHTERPSRVWAGAVDVPYLPARPDDACAGLAGWVSDISAPDVARVLNAAGQRGTAVVSLRVVSRTSSGRADELDAEGLTPGRISASRFQLAAGRTLGWQFVKSTLFDLARTSTGYRFTGKGLGHGVGLCVKGASARAAAGADRDAILRWYFPGTGIGAQPTREVVRVILPESEREQLATVKAMAEQALASLSLRLGVAAPVRVDIRAHPTVESYTRATGMPWWTSGRTRGTTIDLLPAGTLARRGTLESTVRHELVHVLTDAQLSDRPLWVREGLALVMAGESGVGASGEDPTSGSKPAPPTCPSDSDLRDARSAEAWRRAYDAAGRCVARALASGTPWRELR